MKIFITIVLSISLISCDIQGSLYVKNKSQADASFAIVKTEPENNLLIQKLESGDYAGFIFGFGNFWNDERIAEFISDIERLEIKTSRDTLTLSEKSELNSFFRKRRGGLFNSQVKIIIK